MPIYMNYNKLAIKGDVTETGHENWVRLDSFQWGVGRGIGMVTGSTKNREASAPSVSEITVTKTQCNGSVKLLQEALQGTGKDVVIDFTRTEEGGKLTNFMTFTLTNTMISGFSTSSGGDRPSESLSLNFTKLEVKLIPTDSEGKAGSAESFTYDLTKVKIS